MVYLYIAAWILCIAGILLQKNYAFCIGPHMLEDTYERKTADVMEFAVLLSVFLLLCANRLGVDIIRYEEAYRYDHVVFEAKDKLYGFLSIAAYEAGFSFYTFRALLTFATGLLAVITIKKIGTDFKFVLLFYLPSMLFMDSMQFRNAICLSLLLWSFRYLLHRGKYAKVKFFVWTLLAAQIHATYYFALILFVFFIKGKRKQIASLIFLCSIILAAVTVANGSQIPFFSVIADLFLAKTDSRAADYYTSGNLGWVIPTGIHVVTCMLGFAVYRYAGREASGTTVLQREYLELMVVYNLLLFVTVPAIMMNMHYYRMIRGAFIMNVIGSSFLFRQKGKWDKRRYFVLAALILLAVMWYTLDFIIFKDDVALAEPVLNGKLFFLK